VTGLPVTAGFWRSGPSSALPVQCYIEEACLGFNQTLNATDMDAQCAWGHSGPQCNVCLPGFAATIRGGCEQCKSKSPASAIIFVLVMLLVFAGVTR
jgi:hypothetical protein